jgi:Ni/Fe-hydrogenase subunit HybB-like protein
MVAGVGTAVYTAFLFAQAKGRDLWQSPVLAPHLAAQAVLAGGAAVLLLLPAGRAVRADEVLVAVAAGVHLVLVAAEVTLAERAGGHARLAGRQLTVGRYRRSFWISVILVLAGVFVPVVALAGLLAYEHAYVRAGQCVPLA